jgi:hypothetical protein
MKNTINFVMYFQVIQIYLQGPRKSLRFCVVKWNKTHFTVLGFTLDLQRMSSPRTLTILNLDIDF